MTLPPVMAITTTITTTPIRITLPTPLADTTSHGGDRH
jgi:hypothetical protein